MTTGRKTESANFTSLLSKTDTEVNVKYLGYVYIRTSQESSGNFIKEEPLSLIRSGSFFELFYLLTMEARITRLAKRKYFMLENPHQVPSQTIYHSFSRLNGSL